MLVPFCLNFFIITRVRTKVHVGRRKGLLNNDDINGQISFLRRDMSEASGLFKKVRPARPQPFLRAERTGTT